MTIEKEMTPEIAEKALELRRLTSMTWLDIREELHLGIKVGSLNAYCNYYSKGVITKKGERKVKQHIYESDDSIYDWSFLSKGWY
tara:strand:- start:733 stop:987 length:255 start_codon:yes stop_codon:yes gene_type:complete